LSASTFPEELLLHKEINMLDDAFAALKTYDWGADRAPLAPIETAVTATHNNAEARKDLENRLIASLGNDISRDAKDYVCRKLAVVGSTSSAPALAKLLGDEKQSHMARYALERIPGGEVAQTLRDALSKLSGNVKIGVISSIGVRRDVAAVPALSELLKDYNVPVARAAAIALGEIGSSDAGKALQAATPATAEVKAAVIDAQLACAESLLTDNKKSDALAIYKSLSNDQSKLIRLAATRGLLACGAKSA
jgi:HEAT repeat protein